MRLMKMTQWLSGVLVVGLLAFTGCGKSDKGAAQAIPGTMDLAKFRQAFPSPTPEQQASISKVAEGVRYRLYPDAVAALEKLASDPSLSETQKQAVNGMIEGVKAAMTNAPAAPAPQ